MPKLTLDKFVSRFFTEVKTSKTDWLTVGFLGLDHRVFPFGTDTKVLSTIFESLCAPFISIIAKEHGYRVETSEQTVYPDFTLSPQNGEGDRIAIDIKTTYRRFAAKGNPAAFRYTLGSYTSFLRSGTKNIKHPYSDYSDHWVIGFLYSRNPSLATAHHYSLADVTEQLCPYFDVDYFIQDKYKIVGETPASGNTTNIGSIQATNLDPFRKGTGPFAQLGKQKCDEYWKNYAKTKAERAKSYASLDQYLDWVALQADSTPELP